MPRDTRAAFLEALKRADRRIYTAFMETVAAIQNAADLARIERAIEARDVEAVLQAMNMTRAGLEDAEAAVAAAFRDGAEYQNTTAPQDMATGFRLAFSGSHPRVLDWMRENTANLVTEVLEDQRILVRETITAGVEANRGYAKIARDLAGRMDGNRRKGGMIGLHSSQARAVRKARAELEALDTRYFQRARRDKRFDRTIAKAVREGRKLTAADVDKIIGRYSDRLLALRGEAISRTEGSKAMNAGRAEAMEQSIERGDIPAEAVSVTWNATIDRATRDSHAQLHNTTVKWGERFVSPVTGAEMRWPHDESAPPAEAVNCRCFARLLVDYKRVRDLRGT